MVALREEFVEALASGDVMRFVFIGETSTKLTSCRRYGRAPDGQRLQEAVPLHNGPNVTLLAALTPKGLGALLSVNGAVNGDVFAAYLDQVLGPTLQADDVVVLDNLSVHKVAGLDKIAHKYGARLLYLPPYSPDFNPIELAFSKLKTWLRTAQARTRDLLEEAICAAAEWITEADAKNGFDHCGYHVH
ncbi:MAG: IS630 family transposase [Janthinobacterium lividum]